MKASEVINKAIDKRFDGLFTRVWKHHSQEDLREKLVLYQIQDWLREFKIIVYVAHEIIDDSTKDYVWHISQYIEDGLEGSRKKDEWDFWKNTNSLTHHMCWYNTYEKALIEGINEGLKLINDDNRTTI